MLRLAAFFMSLIMAGGCVPQTGELNNMEYKSCFETENVITLSDNGMTLNGEKIGENGDVFVSNDIIYYENKEKYESGFPYGEGTENDMHTAEEAAASTVLNITKSGAYRISGKLSNGQIRIDLGEDADKNPDAIVELILDNADITCKVAPAILYMNVYECDNEWTIDTATSDVDTKDAGAVLILADDSENNITGSHVAKIFKDGEGEKKLWKQDGAIYSYMSMNVFGDGELNLVADNEGLDTELHLTINGGDININSQNDGINTNEDGVSVTTINGGDVRIQAGLGDEGDGIDSNGWLVINDGTVISSANPAADAGLDSDMGSFVNGGTVVALGSTMDWPESDSKQVTMNLQFADQQKVGSVIAVLDENEKVVFAYEPENEINRTFRGAVISSPDFEIEKNYSLYIGGEISGEDDDGIFESVSEYKNGIKQGYTGTDIMRGPGGFGGKRPGNPADMPEGERPERPTDGNFERPEGERPQKPNGERPFDMPEGEKPDGMKEPFQGQENESKEQKTQFYLSDKVNRFSGISESNK